MDARPATGRLAVAGWPKPAGAVAGWSGSRLALGPSGLARPPMCAGPASTSHIRLGSVPQTDSRLVGLALEGTGLVIRVPKVHADFIFRVEVLPPSEGLEPGYVAVSLVPIPASGYRREISQEPPSISHPMAYAVTIPRHLAPTVGPSASSAGVFIRTGLTITTGERVASGLIWRFGSLDCVSDNAGCFADRPFPAGGSVISFGGHDVYVATVAPPRYPRQVLRCASPPPRAGSSAPASPAVVQVMMAGEELPTKNPRTRGPNLERNIDPNASSSGAKAPPPPSRLDEVRAKLSTPLTLAPTPPPSRRIWSAPPAPPQANEELAAAKRQMEITQREYNRAHGLTPGGDGPSRAGQIRRRGRDLGAEIARDGAPSPTPSAEQPVYNTPDKNMRAAQAAAEELNRLEGEELRRQTKRVTELLNAATRQAADPRYVNDPRASHARGAAGNDREGARDSAESASPAPSRHRRPAPEASGARQPARSRLGPRIEPTDARERLDRLVESRMREEEAPAGPKCFGPRIINEPMIDGFQLPRDTPKYDGTAKPEDWLLDYSTAVGIAKGNKRWAVRYSPLMLLGSARTWLNNLPAGSINGWLDFEAAFISNFTGTYRRPGRPQQLEMCKQGPDETDRAYLTRWCEMRNSCEGVHEIQAISFFMGGCRPNTMLWHKLRRSDPQSMAALMAIADKYALAEEAGKPPAEISPAPARRDNNKPAEGASHGSRRDNYRGKRHSDQPDRRYGSAHVAAVADNAAGGSRRQKQDRQWKPKYTFEQMLDSPCKYHSGKNPSNHTTRDCHFMKRLTSGEPLPPPPPPPPAGGPGGQAGAENANLEHHEANQVHHGGRYLAQDATYIIFTSEPEDKTSQQSRSLEVNAVIPPVPQYLNWSEQAITFDRRDTPAVLPKPGSYAMVLDPTIGTTRRSVRFSRVLIDGGSSINILYRDTARKLGIQEAELRPTPTVFHGIVPGHCCQPIGRITLEVMFGKPDHFRTERIEFEVVDLVSPYHALLGRPALTKFMAVPHYGYLKMKLPGPKGVITIAGDYRRSMDCATQSSKMAQTLVIATEKQLIHDAVALAKAAQTDMPAAGNPAGTTHFQPADNTKKILLTRRSRTSTSPSVPA
ncbi:hypothetical protein QYE76_056702 [Lolium multiflorum]|uniref:Retrotransposon gag domain-containing protein n=1 Tax=Lolium multiflorum TaxID=4521 RepID=A0AAD8WQ42_LOLMU|nr:hypothetical protein QYE76_056702 [Lolium multiflorum]